MEDMEETLVQTLREIQGISPYVQVDKGKEYNKALERLRPNNSILRRAMEGETTIPSELEKAIRRVGGLKTFYPHYNILSNEELLTFQELRELLGYPLHNNFYNLVLNPVTLGTVFAGVGAAAEKVGRKQIDYTPSAPKKIDRRHFIKNLPLYASAGIGFVGGLALSSHRYETSQVRRDARYLQSKIEAYRTSTQTKS
ncbi:hypothetical protein HYX03_02355 [Candidatus Woesearchaeota archaeon]|nr:hypothetical protein [Candidatus Woesearchaeota archaeon]